MGFSSETRLQPTDMILPRDTFDIAGVKGQWLAVRVFTLKQMSDAFHT